jgi:hypothetical protein
MVGVSGQARVVRLPNGHVATLEYSWESYREGDHHRTLPGSDAEYGDTNYYALFLAPGTSGDPDDLDELDLRALGGFNGGGDKDLDDPTTVPSIVRHRFSTLVDRWRVAAHKRAGTQGVRAHIAYRKRVRRNADILARQVLSQEKR